VNQERTRVVAGLCVVSFVWGSTWLAIKIGLQSVPPFFAAGVRFVIASAVLYAILRLRNIVVPWSADARRLYLTLIFLSYSIPFGIVYWGQQYIPSGLSSILFAAYPLWVALFSHLLLANERANVFKIIGIVLGFSGIYIIFSGDIHWSQEYGFLGMCAVLLSATMQGISVVLTKKYGQPISPFAMNHVGMLGGAVLLLLAAMILEPIGSAVWDGAAIGSILYLSLVGSVIVFVTYHWLLKRVQAVYLSLTSFINPIIAVILGAIILDEALSPRVFLGAGLVLGGILVANGKKVYARIREAV